MPEPERLGRLPKGIMKCYLPVAPGPEELFNVREVRQAQLDALEEAARAADWFEVQEGQDYIKEGIASAIRRLKEKV